MTPETFLKINASEGVMVAIAIPLEQAALLAYQGEGAIPANELHITLAYLGKAADLPYTAADLQRVVTEWAQNSLPLDVAVNGYGVFENEGERVYWAAVDSQDLPTLRQSLVYALAYQGMAVSSDHGFTPHITLAYLPEGAEVPPDSPEQINFRALAVTTAWAGEWESIPFATALDTVFKPQPAFEVSALHTSPLQVNAGAVRYQKHDGRDFLIVPLVGIVQGVMNGELVLASEFGRIEQAWSDSPIVIGHPVIKGEHVTAKRPDVAHVGRVYNSTVKDDRLSGELWLDIAKLGGDSDGRQLFDRMKNGQIAEVSWGWWRTLERTPGDYDGVPYYGIARNFVPDHLAVLLHETGACSVADGCGTHRVNQADSPAPACQCGCKGASPVVIGSTTTGETIVNQTQEDVTVDDEVNVAVTGQEETVETPAPEPVATPEPVANAAVEKLTQMVNALTAQVDQLTAASQAQAKAEKQAVINRVLALPRNEFSAQELDGFSVNHLAKLERSLQTVSYAGAGMAMNGRQVDETPLTPRPVLLAKKEAQRG